MMDWQWGWGTMMYGGLGMLVFWGLLLALVIWGVRGLSGSAGHTPGDRPSADTRTPLKIAQERYARGEISREEYETISRDLQGT